MHEKKANVHRREALTITLFGAGLVGLRPLATGVPISAIVNGIPNRASAAEATDPPYLILISRAPGAPFNVNAPGSYAEGGYKTLIPNLATINLQLIEHGTLAAAP